MNLPTIDFKEWMPQIWEVVRWFIQLNNPWIMIVAAACIVYGIIQLIAWLMGFKDDEEEEDQGFDYDEY